MNRENERANGGEFIKESDGFPVVVVFLYFIPIFWLP